MNRVPVLLLLLGACTSGCYSGHQTSRDINTAWQGHSEEEIVAEWGRPKAADTDAGVRVLTWSHTHKHISLPSVRGKVQVGPGGFDAYGEARAGRSWETSTAVRASIGAGGTIVDVDGPSLRWGPPEGANIRWGLILGGHAGMGRLDDTRTPLPSGGMYIGGMIGPTLGLVGGYSLAFGADDPGAALGMAWSLGPQWWPQPRVSLRAGPAMILAFDPGFEKVGLESGANGVASYAFVRSGTFALDLRLDLTAGTTTRFATIGVGVNLN